MLKIAAENRRPIRVVRGYKGRAPYAPEEGYRYDGLYVIEQYTRKRGKSGFLICQFKMKRLADQPPLKY
jgi:E3 ubiquitin-protein ligase UHRF1